MQLFYALFFSVLFRCDKEMQLFCIVQSELFIVVFQVSRKVRQNRTQ